MKFYEALDTVYGLARKKDLTIYLVGGALRDYILKYKINDFDFVVEGSKNEIEEICFSLSELLEGTYFLLDFKRGIYRVVKKNLCLDFNQLQSESIIEDLSQRDFTCNSLALSLNTKNLLDPFNGVNDIKNKTLKVINDDIFKDDPLRLLRLLCLNFLLGLR